MRYLKIIGLEILFTIWECFLWTWQSFGTPHMSAVVSRVPLNHNAPLYNSYHIRYQPHSFFGGAQINQRGLYWRWHIGPQKSSSNTPLRVKVPDSTYMWTFYTHPLAIRLLARRSNVGPRNRKWPYPPQIEPDVWCDCWDLKAMQCDLHVSICMD